MYPAEPELRGHQASVERGTPSLPLVKELKVKQPFKSQQDLVKVADLFPPQAVVRRGAELNGLRSPPPIPCLWCITRGNGLMRFLNSVNLKQCHIKYIR